MARIIGYIRVSSKTQLENNSLEQQREEILNRYNNAEIVDEQFTGKTTDRPQLNLVINELQKGDMLVVTKLDRLARNVLEGIATVEELFKKDIAIHVLNIGLLENTTMGRFFLTTLLAVVEMERNIILERTLAGREIARTKEGYKEGRPPKYTQMQLNDALARLSINGGDMSYTQAEEAYKISKSTLTREVRKRKAKTSYIDKNKL